jgi:hypothetical protein
MTDAYGALWNENWNGKLKYLENTCLSATLFSTNSTWPGPELNTGHNSGKLATNCLSQVKAQIFLTDTARTYFRKETTFCTYLEHWLRLQPVVSLPLESEILPCSSPWSPLSPPEKKPDLLPISYVPSPQEPVSAAQLRTLGVLQDLLEVQLDTWVWDPCFDLSKDPGWADAVM